MSFIGDWISDTFRDISCSMGFESDEDSDEDENNKQPKDHYKELKLDTLRLIEENMNEIELKIQKLNEKKEKNEKLRDMYGEDGNKPKFMYHHSIVKNLNRDIDRETVSFNRYEQQHRSATNTINYIKEVGLMKKLADETDKVVLSTNLEDIEEIIKHSQAIHDGGQQIGRELEAFTIDMDAAPPEVDAEAENMFDELREKKDISGFRNISVPKSKLSKHEREEIKKLEEELE
jgi:hypothetical protein